MKQQCSNCKYYREYADNDNPSCDGYCVRFPPMTRVENLNLFPEVERHLYCGEFKPKKKGNKHAR